jgi:hypothetical protein
MLPPKFGGPRKRTAALSKSKAGIRTAALSKSETMPSPFPPHLGWTHYLVLLRVANPTARAFYEIEAVREGWSSRELERQIASLSLRAPREEPGQGEGSRVSTAWAPARGAGRHHEGSVRARVRRDFYVDLVFYNRLLRCFVLVDLKLGKLTHQDLGQMQMYVNFFDRFQRAEHEAKTIGIVLCSEKNDAMAKITLPENSKQILAARYQMYLPTEEELRAELAHEREEAERVLRLTALTAKAKRHGNGKG